MDRLILKSWWKILTVIILMYVIFAGMLVPLKSGVALIDSGNAARTGSEVTLRVTGYNTHFQTGEDSLRAWLKLDTAHQLAARRAEVHSQREASFTFTLPDYLPSTERVAPFTLIVDNAVDGYFVSPAALLVRQDSIDPALGVTGWPAGTQIAGIHPAPGTTFPFRNILEETIRNLYFHVSLWLAMMLLFIAALVYAIRFLRQDRRAAAGTLALDQGILTPRITADFWSTSLTAVGLLFGILGLLTGSVWAKYTWGSWWNWDIKQFTTLIALLIYGGYFVLRAAFTDPEQRARLAAVYNIFAFAALIPLLYILPRLASSLHPGNGGNPALGSDDLDNTMRLVFYPAVIGWTLFGGWLASLLYRLRRVEEVAND
ncbi:MAG: cytochrome c biogenesis protein CcsA [Saprospiraceae bacterium]